MAKRNVLKGTKPKLNPVTVCHLYVKKGLTMNQIAVRYGVSMQAVDHHLRRAGVEKRPRTVPLDREVLYSLCVNLCLSTKEIAKHLGVSIRRVEESLREYQITHPRKLQRLAKMHGREEVERLYVNEGLTQIEAASRLGMTVIMFQKLLKEHGITYRHPRRIPEYQFPEADLRRLYVDEGQTMVKISTIYGCSPATVRYWLKKFGIPVDRYRKHRRDARS